MIPFGNTGLSSNTDIQDPNTSLSRRLTALVELTHVTWVNSMCSILYDYCNQSIVKELTHNTHHDSQTSVKTIEPLVDRNIKRQWKEIQLQSMGDDFNEKISIPNGTTVTLQYIMTAVSGMWQTCIVSTTTIFPIYGPGSTVGNDNCSTSSISLSERLRSMICCAVSKVLFANTYHIYNILQSQNITINKISYYDWINQLENEQLNICNWNIISSLSYSHLQQQQNLEDVALQLYFDLNVCSTVLLYNYITDNTINESYILRTIQEYKDCLNVWSSVIDPINSQLILPHVNSTVESYCYDGKLLLLPHGCTDAHCLISRTQKLVNMTTTPHSHASTANQHLTTLKSIFAVNIGNDAHGAGSQVRYASILYY
jgi:hypothetical protein